jgi:hypothetical protein
VKFRDPRTPLMPITGHHTFDAAEGCAESFQTTVPDLIFVELMLGDD